MIVTLTPNPSVDRTVEVDRLLRGAVLRATGGHVDPGGKGVNVSRALARHGVATRAVLPIGGVEGSQLRELLAPEGVDVVAVKIAGAVRANISVTEPDGTVTKLNEPGPQLTVTEVATLLEATVEAAEAADWVVACGSLPPGVPADAYAQLAARLANRPVRFAVDSSGPALAAVLAGNTPPPHLIKPNRHELAELVGRELVTIGDVVSAADQARAAGVQTVLVSLGADGAVLVDDASVHFGEAPQVVRRSTVGAGDALLAGYLTASAAAVPAPQRLATALAFGAAATALPGSAMPGPSDITGFQVQLHAHPDFDQPLEDQN